MKKFASAFLIAVAGGFAALTMDHYLELTTLAESPDSIVNTPIQHVNMPNGIAEDNMSEKQLDFKVAAAMSVHAVVHVKTSITPIQTTNTYDPFRDFFGQGSPQQKRVQMASGSGVIISKDGYIITNNHVIDQADKIEITLNDKRNYIAKVIGKDPTTDLALLKIEENNLSHLSYGNSDETQIGEWVLAVGNPFNLTSTVTAGIISAKARNINILENNPSKGIHSIESFLQTDAAVNPGNSGGALVNTKGELIGINSAIASRTGSYSGYSFAIPVNIARKVVADLLEFGEVQRAFIGVSIRDLDAKLAKEKNIHEIEGVYVNGLTERGSGKEAGIEQGDIITHIGKKSVNNVPELQEQISRYRPGDQIEITIKRNNKPKLIKLTLRNENGNTDVVQKTDTQIISILGATLEPLTIGEKEKMGVNSGVKVKELNRGKLLSAGIMKGFVILNIDKNKINNIDDIQKALKNKKGGVLIDGVYPNGLRAYYGMGI